MSIGITDDTHVLLYNTVTSRAIPTDTFGSVEEASEFREYATEHGFNLARATVVDHRALADLRRQFTEMWLEREGAAQ
jgi:hypothetical protein